MNAIAGTIVVHGAGSIGCLVGGLLAAAGARVRMVGRPRMLEELRHFGMHLSDLDGRQARVPTEWLQLAREPSALAGAQLILLTVKSQHTAAAAAEIAAHADPGALVLSLQNGVRNALMLRDLLPQQRVLAGMVPFNVVHLGEGRFHRATEGVLHAQDDPALVPWLSLFAQAGVPLQVETDVAAVLWGKLLLNLNNPVNALSGVPLKTELSQRAYRRVLSLLQTEALALMDHAGIQPAKVAKVGPRWLPRLLKLPDWLFRRLAARMLAIDPQARSSMWEDFEKGRTTEIEAINGEIVRLAREHGRQAPANQRIVELVRMAENGGKRDYTGAELWEAVRESG